MWLLLRGCGFIGFIGFIGSVAGTISTYRGRPGATAEAIDNLTSTEKTACKVIGGLALAFLLLVGILAATADLLS